MPLPDFIIIGSMKSGTSALKRLLNAHPDVYMPRGEGHFFNKWYDRGIKAYKKMFVKGKVNGEKTPYYMTDPRLIARIYKHCSKAKLLVVLRDPVVRAVSQRAHEERHGQIQEGTLLEFLNHPVLGPDALWRGMYACQLQYVYAMFPKEQVHIVFGEQLRNLTEPTVNAAELFIGVKPKKLGKVRPSTEREVGDTEGVRRLIEYYRPHNEALHRMVGDDHILTWKGMQ